MVLQFSNYLHSIFNLKSDYIYYYTYTREEVGKDIIPFI